MQRTTTNRVSASLLAASLLAASGCTSATQDNFTNPPAGPPSSCAPVTSLAGCTQGALSYSCTGSRPDDGDTSIVCDDGLPGLDGATLYCCAPYAQWASECIPKSTIAGCGAQSIGFSCSGGTSPDQADTSLVCSAALSGDDGTRDYCCISFDQSSGVCRCASFAESAGTCGVNATECSGAAIGFACAGSHTPADVNPLLDCVAHDGGSNGDFCCKTP
jgi:hypothetical protein